MAKISIASLEATDGKIAVHVGKKHFATILCRDLLKHLRTVDDEIRQNPGAPHPADTVVDMVHAGQIDAVDAYDRTDFALRVLHRTLNHRTVGEKNRAELLEGLRADGFAVVRIQDKSYRSGRSHAESGGVAAAARALPEISDIPPRAGYPIDGVLRRRLKVVRESEAAGGPSILDKTSFRVFAHCLQRNLLAGPHAALLPEIDHAFDLADFYEVYDQSGFPSDAMARLRALPERRIYSYSPINPAIYARSPVDPAPTLVSGISLVRTGDRLMWMLLGGPILDLQAQTAWLDPVLRTAPVGMSAARARQMRPQPLEGTTDVWEVMLWGTLDLASGEQGIFGVSVNVGITIDCFLDVQGPSRRLVALDDAGKVFVEKLALADLVSHLDAFLHLPLYFQARVEYVRDAPARPRTAHGGSPGLAERPLGNRYRTVATLHALPRPKPSDAPGTAAQADEAEPARSRREPAYQVPLDGTWRTLRPTQVGRGPDGKPEIGRTWVREHERYKGKPPRPNQIRVKQPVAASIEAAARETTDGHVTVRY